MQLLIMYGDTFGEKVIGNLLNYSTFCESCGLGCVHCRNSYHSFAQDVVAVIEMPAKLPPLVDDPSQFFPHVFPSCDLVLAIGLHPDLLSHLPIAAQETGAKAVVVPIENRAWCPAGLRNQLQEGFEDLGIEYVFPKPFCSLEDEGGTIGDFVKTYRVGKPEMNVTVEDDTIMNTAVLRSAPCGSTWYVAQQVRWHRPMLLEEVVAKAHHSYPCTASMDIDLEIGDAILHRGGYLIREAVLKAVEKELEPCKLVAHML